ncbi:carboxypeptidase-like regulatory domain-containing protein [Aurantibacter crassamenti]|uniref:carboxypeptidase-like regulatory domain-containing protein n=1 Tax=Aurantibacter crassamenti TaxID=1837375 RepID=UPI001EED0FEE|nr:carboxypeptidase-like regulatory domain-containing protein [Aurantibacter crassamenti]
MMKKTQKLVSKSRVFNVLVVVLMLLVIGSPNAFAFQSEIQNEEASFKEYKGKILDSNSKKPLVFATIALIDSNVSTISNSEGEFSLKIPESVADGKVLVSFLGYASQTLSLSELKANGNKILLNISITELSEVNIEVPKDAENLVRETLKRKGENYFEDPTLMTAFYRETIKKRKRNVSLSEAVVNIYKTPYTSSRRDAVQLYKARKSTDYEKLDTLTLKLQGGPFNTLFVDVMKYPEYIFTDETISDYVYSFDGSTRVNDKLIYIIDFKQREDLKHPLYKGKLYINAENKILTSAIYTLNITDKDEASRLFVRKKPKNAKVWPTEVAYRVDYREKKNKWYYGYSNVMLEFKIDWDRKLFNSVYSMTCEMAVTNWKKNLDGSLPKGKDRIRSSIILIDEAIGFSDPDFWGAHNIIEPEKSIESAIKKIQRQLKRAKPSGGTGL